MEKDKSLYILYKGFGIQFIKNQYRAGNHTSPEFTETSLVRLKKLINNYLNN